MNKKVMALAVAGVLAAPAALAQTSNVQLYGRAVLGIDNYSAEGARNTTAAGASCPTVGVGGCVSGGDVDRTSRIRIFDNSSRVGLRGTEDLGNGLKAIFQIETGVNIDNGSNTGQGGQANASSGFWATRDSFVGLDSNFGRLTFGRQSIYWANGVNAQFAANYINTEIPWTNGTAMGRISAPGTTPARVSNTVQYTSPTFAGLNGTLSWSPGQGTGEINQEIVQGDATQDTNASIWGATLRGTWGPFYAQVDYADVSGNTQKGLAALPRIEGNAWKVGGSWGYMPGARIGLIWVRSESNAVTGLARGDQANQQGWTVNWEHTFGNFQVMAQYGQLGDLKECDGVTLTIDCGDSKARGYMIGGRYFLSKRTWLFASYNMVDNKSNNFSDYNGGAITSVSGAPVPYGADPEIWALGIFHQF
jgi:predicted porin